MPTKGRAIVKPTAAPGLPSTNVAWQPAAADADIAIVANPPKHNRMRNRRIGTGNQQGPSLIDVVIATRRRVHA